MKKNRFLKYLIPLFLIIVLLQQCSDPSNKEKPLVNMDNKDFKTKILLDSINSLDSMDLIKINTRGCVGNCLPRETFLKLQSYENKLKELGCFTRWDPKTGRYYLAE